MSVISLADRVFFTAGENIRSFRDEGSYRMLWAGVFDYLEDGAYSSEPETVARALFEHRLDYNALFGSYRIAFLNERTDELTAFGDSCGTTGFFYDADSGVFADSLLYLLRRRKNVSPCLEAVANVFSHAPELRCLTPVEGIRSTSPDSYYTVKENAAPEEHDKKLSSPDSTGYGIDLREITAELVSAVFDEKYSAVCTGGTDSRAVIAAITAAGGSPELIITGPPDFVDVRLARTIAERLDRPLTVIDSTQKEENWLARSFEFSDGCYDTVLCYRHYKKTRAERRAGIKYEFGGCGGEFYKNDFYKKGRGVPAPGVIARQLYNSKRIPGWLSDELKAEADKIYDRMEAVFSGCCRSGRLYAYNDAGRKMLRASMGGVSSPISRWCIKIDPLTEPRVIASVGGNDPKELELHRWQRRQIALCAPQLCPIPTDQGYTCSADEAQIREEIGHARRRNTVLWVKRTGKKLSRSLARHSTSVWNSDYSGAMSSAEFSEAFAVCKRLGLIAPDVTADRIPAADAGVIMQIGLLFSDKYGLKEPAEDIFYERD